jgi:hypothetical protein
LRTRSLSILATTATLAALLGCPLEGLKSPDAASLGAESDSVGGVANSASHDDAVDAAGDVSWADGQLPAGSSALRVLMTDAPVEADSVFVTFCGIFVEPAAGDMGGSVPDPRVETGAGGAYGGSDTGTAGAPSAPSSGGAGGSGSSGAAGAPSPEYDAEKAEAEAERAEAERIEAARAAGAEEPAPIDPEREAAEREAAEREAAEGLPTDDRAGDDAIDPAMNEGAPREAWRPLNQECQTLDLLTLRDGVTEAVGVATLPPGRYGQIRLMLVDASIVVDGVEHELRIPSGMESGLKIQSAIELLDGGATTVTLDFDAGRSVQYIEGSGYQLMPVINVINVISHADMPGAEPREPALPGTDPSRMPPSEGAGGSAGAGTGGAGGDGAGGRAPMPPPPPGAEPPPPDAPKAGDEPLPPEPPPPPPPPPADEPPPAEEPEDP